MVLAVCEAVANIAEHGYADSPQGAGSVRSTAYRSRAAVLITMLMTGAGAATGQPYRSRGVALIQQLVEHVYIDHTPTGTVVHLRATLPPPAAHPAAGGDGAEGTVTCDGAQRHAHPVDHPDGGSCFGNRPVFNVVPAPDPRRVFIRLLACAGSLQRPRCGGPRHVHRQRTTRSAAPAAAPAAWLPGLTPGSRLRPPAPGPVRSRCRRGGGGAGCESASPPIFGSITTDRPPRTPTDTTAQLS